MDAAAARYWPRFSVRTFWPLRFVCVGARARALVANKSAPMRAATASYGTYRIAARKQRALAGNIAKCARIYAGRKFVAIGNLQPPTSHKRYERRQVRTRECARTRSSVARTRISGASRCGRKSSKRTRAINGANGDGASWRSRSRARARGRCRRSERLRFRRSLEAIEWRLAVAAAAVATASGSPEEVNAPPPSPPPSPPL